MTDDKYELAVVAAMRMAKPKDARMRITFGGEVLLKYMVAQGLVNAEPDANGCRRLTPKGEELAHKEILARLEAGTQH
jgi:hypothetical protein